MTKWISGYNMPGYMPDNEPAEHETWEDAMRSVVWTMNQFADEDGESGDEESAEELTHAATELGCYTSESEYGQTIGKYHFWIVRD